MSKALATKNVAAALVAAALVVGFSLAYATTAKAQTVTTTTTSTASYTFTLNEKLGMRGAEVMQIQKFLNSNGFTIATTGAGSAGNETTYFGGATKKAVMAFQTAKAISPVSGYWGPLTRAAANAVGGTTTGTTTTTGGTTTTGPGITVTAAAQPANGLAVQGASRVPFTTFTITNNSGAAVTVNSVSVMRTGPASDSVFTGGGVILVDENGTQLGVQRTLNSDHTVAAGDPFTLAAGQTKTITVEANMGSSLSTYTGQVVGLTVTGVNTTVAVNGSLPITGAMQTINGSLQIGQVTTNISSYDPNGAQQKNIGDTGVKFTGLRFTAGSAEDIKLYSVRFRLNGSVSSSDLSNVVAVVDGTTYPTTISTDGRYYTVNIAGGLLIQKGFSKDVYLQGDITGSNASGRVVEFDVDRTSDVYFVGQSFGYGIQPAVGSQPLAPVTNNQHATAVTATQPWFEGSTVTISGASVTTIGRANSVGAQNIAVNVPNVVLGGFETNLKGEAINVQTLPITVAVSDATANLLTNVSIVDENGSVVAGPVDETVLTSTTGKITFTNAITFPTGDHVYTIKGKVPAAAANNSTITLSTDAGGLWTGVTGQTTGNTVSSLPSGSFAMNAMTVRAATLAVSVSPTPAAQSIVPGAQNLVLANIQLDASQSGEDIRVSNLPATIALGGNVTFSQLSACRVYNGATSLTSGSNVLNPIATSTNLTFDNSITVAKGTVTTLAIECNVSSNATTGTVQVGLGTIGNFNATGVTSSNLVGVTGTTGGGQQMTLGAATLAVSLDSSSPSAKLAAGGTTGVELADYKFRASNDNISLQQIGLKLTSGTQSDLSNVTIWNGSTKVGSVLFTGSTALVNLSTPVTLTRDTDVVLTVKGDLAGVGPSQAGTSGHVIKVDIDSTTLTNTYGVSSSGIKVTAASASSAVAGVTLYRSFPVVSQDTLSSTGASDGNLIRFKATANSSGSIGIDQVAFSVTYSGGGVTVANAKLYAFTDAAYSTPVSGQASDGLVGALVATVTSGTTYKVPVLTNTVSVGAGQTVYFALRADVVAGTGTSIVTKILGDSTAVTPAIDSAVETSSNFVWSPNTNGTTAPDGVTTDFVNGAGVLGLPSAGFTQARGL